MLHIFLFPKVSAEPLLTKEKLLEDIVDLIYLFRFIPNPEAKKKAQAAAAPAPAPVAAPVEAAEADDTELIAVIAAAIAAAEGTTTDGFVVRSIRKINRKKR